jgi:uncharacterized protein
LVDLDQVYETRSGHGKISPRVDFGRRRRYDSGNASDFIKPVKTFAKPTHAGSLDTPAFLSVQRDGVLLAVKLQPRASKNEICAPLGNELKIKVTAPPVDAAANQALVEFLAEKLDCPRGKVELLRGHKSRHKTIMLHGFKLADILSRL